MEYAVAVATSPGVVRNAPEERGGDPSPPATGHPRPRQALTGRTGQKERDVEASVTERAAYATRGRSCGGSRVRPRERGLREVVSWSWHKFSDPGLDRPAGPAEKAGRGRCWALQRVCVANGLLRPVPSGRASARTAEGPTPRPLPPRHARSTDWPAVGPVRGSQAGLAMKGRRSDGVTSHRPYLGLAPQSRASGAVARPGPRLTPI